MPKLAALSAEGALASVHQPGDGDLLVVDRLNLVEGFGLTVAEAMWKRRPVVASALDGIRDQITDGVDWAAVG